jgi:hypothetical protein
MPASSVVSRPARRDHSAASVCRAGQLRAAHAAAESAAAHYPLEPSFQQRSHLLRNPFHGYQQVVQQRRHRLEHGIEARDSDSSCAPLASALRLSCSQDRVEGMRQKVAK